VKQDRHIHTEEVGLPELIGMLSKNELLIPSFQREFVWEPQEIIQLWDSLYRFYPIGSLLCWETALSLHVHRKIGGFILPENGAAGRKGPRRYILDGQQRATAIMIAVLGGEGRVRGRREQPCLAHALYFDAVGGTFFFGYELKRRRRKRDPVFLIPLKEIMTDAAKVRRAISEAGGCDEAVLSNLGRLARVFGAYRIPVIWIRGFDIPAVRDIFMRINQEGQDLKPMDIMIAKTFQDYEYLVEDDLWTPSEAPPDAH